MLEPTRPSQHTLLSVFHFACVCVSERESEHAFICFASPSFPCWCPGPLRNVSVPFCQSRSQSAETQKVTLSFTQPLIKPTELWSPSCHCSSLRPSLTHSFVSLPPHLHHSSVFPLFISFYILTPLSSPYLCSVSSLPCHLSISPPPSASPPLPFLSSYDYQVLVAT